MSVATRRARVLLVCADASWDERHPLLATERIRERLSLDGHDVHELPLPVGHSGRSLHPLSLMPVEPYGDVLLGLGHASLVLRHRTVVAVVDRTCEPALRPWFDEPWLRRVDRGLIVAGLRRARTVVAADAATAAIAARERGAAVEDAADLDEVLARIGGFARVGEG